MPHRTTILVAASVVAVVALLAWSFRPQPLRVDIVEVQNAPVTVSVREQARTRVKDRFEISAPVAGYAPRLDWDVGDRVEAGEVLVNLRPLPVQVLDRRDRESAEAEVARAAAALDAAQAALEASRATAELAQAEYQRLEPLFERGTISASQLDRARAERNQARAALRSAGSEVEVARQALRLARAALVRDDGEAPEVIPLRAPVAGQVLQVIHESAGVVQPGEKLMCIADPASMEVLAEVLTADAVRLHPGMPVELERWGGDAPLRASVRRIEPAGFTKISALGVEEQRTRVIMDLESPPEQWQSLGDGFQLEARFILWHSDNALSVPNGTLFAHDDGQAVFVVENGRAILTPVTIGERGEARTRIVEGLTPGQRVINHPDRELEPGGRVEGFVHGR